MSRAYNNNNNNNNNNIYGYEKDKSFCIKPVYYNPRRQNRSQSLDVDALERSGIRNVLLQVMLMLISLFYAVIFQKKFHMIPPELPQSSYSFIFFQF